MPASHGMIAADLSGRGWGGWNGGTCQLKLTQLMSGACVPWSPARMLPAFSERGWRGWNGAMSQPQMITGGATNVNGNRLPWSPVGIAPDLSARGCRGWNGGNSHP